MSRVITNSDPTSAVRAIEMTVDGNITIYGEPYLWTKNIHHQHPISQKDNDLLTFTSQRCSPYYLKNQQMLTYALQLLAERRLVSDDYLRTVKRVLVE